MKVKYKGPITHISPINNWFEWVVYHSMALRTCSKCSRKRITNYGK